MLDNIIRRGAMSGDRSLMSQAWHTYALEVLGTRLPNGAVEAPLPQADVAKTCIHTLGCR